MWGFGLRNTSNDFSVAVMELHISLKASIEARKSVLEILVFRCFRVEQVSTAVEDDREGHRAIIIRCLYGCFAYRVGASQRSLSEMIRGLSKSHA